MKLPDRIFLHALHVGAIALGTMTAAPGVRAIAAESVLDRIAGDGLIRAGTRASAAPVAQKMTPGEFKGFSVDLLQEIRAATQRSVGRPVRVELHEVTPSDRLHRVGRGDLDIVCGITTPTWDRETLVDFSLPLPSTRPLATESLACVLPQNDSRWRDRALFYSLDRAMRDYLARVSIWAK